MIEWAVWQMFTVRQFAHAIIQDRVSVSYRQLHAMQRRVIALAQLQERIIRQADNHAYCLVINSIITRCVVWYWQSGHGLSRHGSSPGIDRGRSRYFLRPGSTLAGWLGLRERVGTVFKRILIVCTGNICRSTTAEYLFRQCMESRDMEFSSA